MDTATLRRHLEESHRDCYAWALSCCDRDLAEADDVLQTTYLKVLDGRAHFDGRSSFRTWLFGVIRHTAADERRRGIVRRIRHAVLGNDIPAPDDSSLLAEAGASHAALRGALAHLPRRQREVLLLVFYHSLTIQESARVLGIGLGSARTHYERGKRRLRELLNETPALAADND
jgi:RNA polymerase sigma-70 factor (ECF subfamily)